MPCPLVKRYQHYKGLSCLHPQGYLLQEDHLMLEMEALHAFRVLGTVHMLRHVITSQKSSTAVRMSGHICNLLLMKL
jgi:hypothetical protein